MPLLPGTVAPLGTSLYDDQPCLSLIGTLRVLGIPHHPGHSPVSSD